ncbi:Hsp20/alpha crystallin family protein [Telmatospirillum sp. J64-1]|uniref:Hsp20/alpha crystallin family protein n=1 Tax=Telmatospirillum sp. J64-1 TaxID=2502183 RepID=UPI00115C8A25|nr:Hsp20/alpha crystallin family protein [Telmatospirillum sp. J64-1]
MATQDKPTPSVTSKQGQEMAHPLSGLRNEMDRLFDNFLVSPFGRRMFDFEPLRQTGISLTALGEITPHVDVKETDKAFEITAEMPGIDPKDLDVSFADGVLTIKGEKRSEKESEQANYHLSERSYGRFERSFRLPETVDTDKIDASCDNGLLLIEIPKKAQPEKQARRIEVGSGSKKSQVRKSSEHN